MRFAPSLDDSVLVHVAGGLTAVVAAVTALFSGHAMFWHPTESAAPAAPIEVTAQVEPIEGGDTAAPALVEGFVVDTGEGAVEPPSPKTPLCDSLRTKEVDVDTLNQELDGLLQDLQSKKHQRRK